MLKSKVSYTNVKNGRYDKTKILDDTFTEENNNFDTKIEIPTGSYEGSKLRNIYDLAGNMWEWTTEVGDQQADQEADNITRRFCCHSWW